MSEQILELSSNGTIIRTLGNPIDDIPQIEMTIEEVLLMTWKNRDAPQAIRYPDGLEYSDFEELPNYAILPFFGIKVIPEGDEDKLFLNMEEEGIYFEREG